MKFIYRIIHRGRRRGARFNRGGGLHCSDPDSFRYRKHFNNTDPYFLIKMFSPIYWRIMMQFVIFDSVISTFECLLNCYYFTEIQYVKWIKKLLSKIIKLNVLFVIDDDVLS